MQTLKLEISKPHKVSGFLFDFREFDAPVIYLHNTQSPKMTSKGGNEDDEVRGYDSAATFGL